MAGMVRQETVGPAVLDICVGGTGCGHVYLYSGGLFFN